MLAAAGPFSARAGLPPGAPDFETACAMRPPALLDKDPAFERSVFITGARWQAAHAPQHCSFATASGTSFPRAPSLGMSHLCAQCSHFLEVQVL